MVKTTIDIPDELWKKFSITVIEEQGGRKKNDVIETLIEDYVSSHNGVMCRNCFATIDLAAIQPKGGVRKSSWWQTMMTPTTNGAIFKATCPRCKKELTYGMKEVRPIHVEPSSERLRPHRREGEDTTLE